MSKRLFVILAVCAAPLLAEAQATASVQLNIGLPVVLPQLVVVQPGVQVVPDQEQEVFYTGGYYYVRQDGGWYRSRNHRGGWVLCPVRTVPAALVKIPPGHYRHYRPAPRPAPAPVRYERRDDDRDDDHDHDHHDNGRHRGHGKHGKHDRD
jgi:hypothetical protein